MDPLAIRTEMIKANGLSFEVDICGDGPKFALALHGFPESKYSWRHQLPMLARLGYTVWAPNMRGYGQSSRPHGKAAYEIDHLVDDAVGLIDAAAARGLSGPTTLLAHDWGGMIGWTCALRQTRPLDRFIVMNLPHPTLFHKRLYTWAQLKRSWYMFFFQLPWLPEQLLCAFGARAIDAIFRGMAVDKSRFPKAVLDHYRKNALIPGAMTAMLNYYRASLGNPALGAEWRNPPIIDTPTLMIWGEKDAALGLELTHGTDALMRDLTFRTLPGVSHWVQQEAPETVNAMIMAWLTGEPVLRAGHGGRLLLANVASQ